jgi:histidinol-phosphatase
VTVFSFGDDLSLALAAAADADLVSMARFRQADLTITQKPDRTPVTDADRAVEDIVRAKIHAARPDDGILGEEGGTTGATGSGRVWVIDPIDGTAGFLRGLPIWATLIALVVDGIPRVGVVSAPALGQRWWAADGAGAWTRKTGHPPEAIRVSGVAALDDAVISYNNLPGWIDAGYHDALITLVGKCWRARAIGDFWAYMLVAEGQIDIAGEWDLQPYDIAALWPIVEQAGGQFSALTGEKDIGLGSALATNGPLHDDVVAIVRGKIA